MRVLLLTGPGGDAQGWGDLGVTQCVGEAIKACGHSARIAWIETDSDFHKAIKDGGFDIVWSALYYITPNEKFIGRNESGTWVADVLDMLHIPYIGSNSQTMKDMIDKFETHEILHRAGDVLDGDVPVDAVQVDRLAARGDDALDATPPQRGRGRLACDLSSVIGIEGETRLDGEI